MNILVIGDITGRPGREIIKKELGKLKKKHQIEFAIANAENAAGGSGITPNIAEELWGYGIDVLTSGDHVWKKKEVLEILDKDERLLRPANYPKTNPGSGSAVFTTTVSYTHLTLPTKRIV